MTQLYDVVSSPDGSSVLRPADALPLTPAELAGANSGQRADLLQHAYRVYYLTTDPAQLFQPRGGRLEPVITQKEQAAAQGVYSPVFLVNATRALVDAYGNPVGEVVSGDNRYPEVTNFAALPAAPCTRHQLPRAGAPGRPLRKLQGSGHLPLYWGVDVPGACARGVLH